jgi:nucleoid DNA-binding protein
VKNPRTGVSLTLRASIVPAFRAAKALKEMVNRKR